MSKRWDADLQVEARAEAASSPVSPCSSGRGRALRRARAVHPIAALQTEYSLWTRDVKAEVVPVCRELGVGLVAYSPLGWGFLTGRFPAFRRFC